MNIQDDIHDQLTKAYLEYFKANENFESRLSHRTHLASRKWLREIRRLAKLRQEEIHITYAAKKAAEKQKAK
tara:strand:+ start:125 stop:340 length:216 start_codon:yes stop_codon:yes gene_type:complete